jgi:hypothetical protein
MAVATSAADLDLKHTPEIKQVVSNNASVIEGEEELEAALRNYVPGTDLEKKLVRKVDFYMIPTLWFMCILCYLNRNNIVSGPSAEEFVYCCVALEFAPWLTPCHRAMRTQRE